MKLFLKAGVLAGCAFTALYSMEILDDLQMLNAINQEASAKDDSYKDGKELHELVGIDDVPQEVVPFSKAYAEAFKDTLVDEQRVRWRYQVFAGGLLAIAGTYFLYRTGQSIHDWWKDSDDAAVDGKQGVNVRLNLRRQENKDLEERIKKLEVGKKLATSSDPLAQYYWSNYLWQKTRDFGGGLARFIPRVGRNIASLVLVSHGYSIAKRIAPMAAGDYLFEGRTIGWCIETKTTLLKSVRDLAHWAEDLVSIQRPHELACLSVSVSVFNQEVEKVVGYMLYIKDQLTPKREIEMKRARVSLATIEKLVDDLVRESNGLITGEKKLDDTNRAEVATQVKATVSAIISQMEKFEVVQQALGYENFERTKTFDDLKAELIPEIRKLRTQAKVFKRDMDNFNKLLDSIKPAEAA